MAYLTVLESFFGLFIFMFAFMAVGIIGLAIVRGIQFLFNRFDIKPEWFNGPRH